MQDRLLSLVAYGIQLKPLLRQMRFLYKLLYQLGLEFLETLDQFVIKVRISLQQLHDEGAFVAIRFVLLEKLVQLVHMAAVLELTNKVVITAQKLFTEKLPANSACLSKHFDLFFR